MKNSRRSAERSGGPYTGDKKWELRDESSFPPGEGLGAKGKATMKHGDAPQAHALPCPIHHVDKGIRHREGLHHLGFWGAKTGPHRA